MGAAGTFLYMGWFFADSFVMEEELPTWLHRGCWLGLSVLLLTYRAAHGRLGAVGRLALLLTATPLLVPLYLQAIGWNHFLWAESPISGTDLANSLRRSFLLTPAGAGAVIGVWASPDYCPQ